MSFFSISIDFHFLAFWRFFNCNFDPKTPFFRQFSYVSRRFGLGRFYIPTNLKNRPCTVFGICPQPAGVGSKIDLETVFFFFSCPDGFRTFWLQKSIRKSYKNPCVLLSFYIKIHCWKRAHSLTTKVQNIYHYILPSIFFFSTFFFIFMFNFLCWIKKILKA